MADVNDWGTKASLKGYPIQTCADHQCLFHSSWPVLKIEAQGSYTATGAAGNETIYNHGLGYPPIFLTYSKGYFGENTDRSYLGFTVGSQPAIDENNLIFYDPYDEVNAGDTIYYYIFRYDMTTDFESTQISGTSLTPESIDDYGLKISKEGKDVSSTDYRDFIIHSSCRSLQIHKTGYYNNTDVIWNKTIAHGLSYAPMVWGFFKNPYSNYWVVSISYTQEAFGYSVKADDTNIYLSKITTDEDNPIEETFYIAFKDPYTLAGE